MNISRSWSIIFVIILSIFGSAIAESKELLQVCDVGMQPCIGKYGSGCYNQIGGQSCTQGQVCNKGEQPCIGKYGSGCYNQIGGQSCTQGLRCNIGEQPCIKNGQAKCFNPSRGQSCN